MSTAIQTKFGPAKIGKNGYYYISDKSTGLYLKLLHRLVFEDFYKIKLPSNIIIHHEDGDKLNNEIWNLIPMTRQEHNALHSKGVPMPEHVKEMMSKIHKGKILSDETKEKISNSKKGVKLKDTANMSKNKNSSGFFRVSTKPCPQCNQGFSWVYQYYDENGKQQAIHSVNLLKLKQKVINSGQDWFVINNRNALKTCVKYDYLLSEVC